MGSLKSLSLNNVHAEPTDAFLFLKTISAVLFIVSGSINEIYENLEQLRFLDNGYDIYLEEIEELSIGIDTETDYKKALEILNDND